MHKNHRHDPVMMLSRFGLLHPLLAVAVAVTFDDGDGDDVENEHHYWLCYLDYSIGMIHSHHKLRGNKDIITIIITIIGQR